MTDKPATSGLPTDLDQRPYQQKESHSIENSAQNEA